MNPDDVYTLLAEADPVPDDGATPTMNAVLDRLRPPPIGSETMQLTINELTNHDAPSGGQPTRTRWIAAAAAALIAVATLGTIVLTRDDAGPIDRADEPLEEPIADPGDEVPPAVDAERAQVIAAEYVGALFGGDVDTVMALSDHGSITPEANRRLAEMWAVRAERGLAPTVADCTTRDATAWIEVRCNVTLDDPIHVALGETDAVFPLRVNDDGTVRWLELEQIDFQTVNRAVADYLRAYRPSEYDAVCIPGAYDPGSIVSNVGLALTGTCAELWIPLGDDIAEWIRADRPAPVGTPDPAD